MWAVVASSRAIVFVLDEGGAKSRLASRAAGWRYGQIPIESQRAVATSVRRASLLSLAT